MEEFIKTHAIQVDKNHKILMGEIKEDINKRHIFHP